MQRKSIDACKGNGQNVISEAIMNMLERKNPGIVTHLETNQIRHFKYCFMALGVSIWGFRGTVG